MRMCDWKPEETSLLHPITPSVPFVQDEGEWERVALTGCLPCGYMVTWGMPLLTANTLSLRTPASPSTRGQIPGLSLGTRLCPFWTAEGCQSIWRGVLLKQIPLLTLRLDFPPEFPDVPLRYCPALSPTDQEKQGIQKNQVQLSCPSANVPNKQQKQTRISIRVFQPCNSTSKLQGFFAEI